MNLNNLFNHINQLPEKILITLTTYVTYESILLSLLTVCHLHDINISFFI